MMAIFLSIVDFCCFDLSFYSKIYRQENTAAEIGVTQDTLDEMTDILLDYLKDRRQDIDGEALIKGEMREIYDEREKLHMVDVKALYQKAILLRNVCAVLALIMMVALYIKYKKDMFLFMRRDYVKALIVFAGIFALLGIYALTDFDQFWTNFHLLLFDNDLWLLDPATEIMINMVPSAFFSALVYRILVLLFIALAVLYLFFKVMERRVCE